MATKAAAAVKVETVSTRQLASQLAEKHELSQKQGNAILEDLIGLISKHLKKGVRVPQRSGHPAGAQARRPHGPQSGDRRGHQDQGQQEGRVPRRQRAQAEHLRLLRQVYLFRVDGPGSLVRPIFIRPAPSGGRAR